MLIIPAIDLINGKCVRLERGDFNRVKVYSDNPVDIARSFEDAGVRWIHIVDLDAARGRENNREVIGRIKKAVSCRVEVGGGVRKESDVKQLVEIGVDRIILGTIVVRDIKVVEAWVRKYGNVFIAGIDAKDGIVRVSGWEESTEVEDVELAKRVRDIGIEGIIYTNISRDGLLTGPDIDRTNLIARVSGIRVVLSGGIGSENDIRYVFNRGLNVAGVITGKAVYERKIDLDRMVKLYQNAEDNW